MDCCILDYQLIALVYLLHYMELIQFKVPIYHFHKYRNKNNFLKKNITKLTLK